jgi:hypothetical protein
MSRVSETIFSSILGVYMSLLTLLVGSKIAIGAMALGTVAAGGTAVAAYTGNLPAPLQQSAHSLIGAPAPAQVSATVTAEATPSPSSPVGPDATGAAAFGLCQAYTHGGLATSSVAYGSLLKAAGTSGDVAAYCATVVSPGQSATHKPTAPAAGAGQSATHKPADVGGGAATTARSVTPPASTEAANKTSGSTGRP